MEFVLLRAGDFVVGSPAREARHQADETQRPSRIARPFSVATHEVTRAQWARAISPGVDVPPAEAALTADANDNGDFPLTGRAGANRRRALPVGSFAPNACGLYDMHGNVWEWTSDAYDDTRKVIRGGSWRFDADSARCALRYSHRPENRGDSLGLRIVRDLTKDDAGTRSP